MSSGVGQLSWACHYPWHQHWGHHCHGELDRHYDWTVAAPYRAPWGPVSKDQEVAMLEDEARALEEELSQVKKRLEEIKK